MDFSSVSQWWAEWQLQFLVLASLAIQCVLVILGGLRRHCTAPYFKLLLWLFFLSGDVMALYALAAPMLQWRMQQCISPQRTHDLEVLWAPVLLMQLGGQRCITALKLEDNEQWKNHAFISLVKVILAVNGFWNSWSPSADNRLYVAAVLLFISGIVKCVDRPLSLKSSSIHSLSNFMNEVMGTTRTQKLGLKEYVRSARALFLLHGKANIIPPAAPSAAPPAAPPVMPPNLPQNLFLDIPYNFSDRLSNLRSFLELSDEEQHKLLRSEQTATFELVFTKTHTPLIGKSRAPVHYFYVTLVSATVLPVVAILLLHVASKHAYRGVDVAVTFVLLYGTFAVEIISVWLMFRSRTMWPDMVAQQNIFQYCAHNRRHSKLIRFAGWFSCKDLIDKYYLCMDPCYDSWHITRVIRTHIELMWRDFIKKPKNYIGYTNVRGQWILQGMGCVQRLGWSIEMPFDECVIIWHIVTEIICYRRRRNLPRCLAICKEMSNYMTHLFFAEPEMLVPGSRMSMFKAAYNQLCDILAGEVGTWDDAEGILQKLHHKMEAGRVPEEGNFFRDAWKVVEGLQHLSFEKRCTTIKGMWVEMLCFSAGRCRGYLHAQSLGSSGGEYLSCVSLLLTHTGMPTLADRLQTAHPFRREVLPEADEVPPDEDVLAEAAEVLEQAMAELIKDKVEVLPNTAEVFISTAAVLVYAAERVPDEFEVLEEAADVLAELSELDQLVVDPAEVLSNSGSVYIMAAVVLVHAADRNPENVHVLVKASDVLKEVAAVVAGRANVLAGAPEELAVGPELEELAEGPEIDEIVVEE